MKNFAGVLLLFALLLLFVPAQARAAECPDVAAFIQADQLFTQAEKAESHEARELWTQGTQLLRRHSVYTSTSCTDRNEFDLFRLRAALHGLAIGYAWSGKDAVDARYEADTMWATTMNNEQVQQPPVNAELEMYNRWQNVYDDANRYRIQIDSQEQDALIARHFPKGPGCLHPSVEAQALKIITPEFPVGGRGIRQEVTVLVAVIIDETGKVAETRLLRGSGNRAIDAAAIDAASKTTYLPKIMNCKAVKGIYTFRTTFDPYS